MSRILLDVNGKTHKIEAGVETPLIFVLRNNLGLMGAKLGCGLEQCGACAVLVDGERTLSCVRAASEFEGTKIQTVEGLSENGCPSAVQTAFIEEGAAQCGYCTSGLVIAVSALLKKNAKPTRTEICGSLHDHLCRCGSHLRVLKAVDRVITGNGNNGT